MKYFFNKDEHFLQEKKNNIKLSTFWQNAEKDENILNQKNFFDSIQYLIDELNIILKLDAKIEAKIRNIIRKKPVTQKKY